MAKNKQCSEEEEDDKKIVAEDTLNSTRENIRAAWTNRTIIIIISITSAKHISAKPSNTMKREKKKNNIN